MTFSGHDDSTINIVLGLLLLLFPDARRKAPGTCAVSGRGGRKLGWLTWSKHDK